MILFVFATAGGSVWGWKSWTSKPPRFPKKYSVLAVGFGMRAKVVINYLVKRIPSLCVAKSWPTSEQIKRKKEMGGWKEMN